MSHRHAFDVQTIQPAAETEEESEEAVERVGESHHDSNIRFHENCTCRIVQGSFFAGTGRMAVEEEDDMNPSPAS